MRKFPELPQPLGLESFSILDALGMVDPATSHGPADGADFAETIVSALQWRTGPDLIVYDPLAAGMDALQFGKSPFDGAAPGTASSAWVDTTLLDTVYSAKGGSPGGGGGGSGGGSGSAGSYWSGEGNGSAGYDIWLDFKGSGWTADLQQAFKDAADYFTTVITADIGGDGRFRNINVDDLYVTAELATIDGQGGVLGQAGPTAVWSASELTAAGQMQFDVADALTYLSKGLWDDIVTHEMMHVLGFGSLWNYGDNPLVSGEQYTGAAGLAAYRDAQQDQNLTFIPVETDGGSGTAGAHWDEQTLGNELMTGYINDDNNAATVDDNYLSAFSVMSLADLGYKVNYADYPHDGILL